MQSTAVERMHYILSVDDQGHEVVSRFTPADFEEVFTNEERDALQRGSVIRHKVAQWMKQGDATIDMVAAARYAMECQL